VLAFYIEIEVLDIGVYLTITVARFSKLCRKLFTGSSCINRSAGYNYLQQDRPGCITIGVLMVCIRCDLVPGPGVTGK